VEELLNHIGKHALRLRDFSVWFATWDYAIEFLIIGSLVFLVVYWLSESVKALVHSPWNTCVSLGVIFIAFYGVQFMIATEGFGVWNTKWFYAMLVPLFVGIGMLPKKDNMGHGTRFQRFGRRG